MVLSNDAITRSFSAARLRMRAPGRFILITSFVVAASIAGARSANAADEPPLQGDQAMEEQLKHGIALRRAGSDDAALAVFLDLEKRAPDAVRLLLHITTAAQATGKWLMAYDYLQKAGSHKDDPYYQRHRASIDIVEKAIAQHVGQFRAKGTPAGAEVRLNGEVVGTLPLTTVKAVEVGSYIFEVAKPGYYPLRRQVTITGGGGLSQETVELREAKSSLAAASDAQPSFAGRAGVSAAGATPTSWTGAPWVTWALAGAAVAAATTSGVAFVIRERKASRWNDNSLCLDSTSPLRTREDVCGAVRRDAKLAEGIGIAAGIGAVTLGAAALIHGLTTRRSSDSANLPSSTCSPGLGSIVCYGTF